MSTNIDNIIFSFALSQLLLNINKKVKLMIFLFPLISLWLLFGFFITIESMLHLTGRNLLKVIFCITINQRAQPDEAFLIFSL